MMHVHAEVGCDLTWVTREHGRQLLDVVFLRAAVHLPARIDAVQASAGACAGYSL